MPCGPVCQRPAQRTLTLASVSYVLQTSMSALLYQDCMQYSFMSKTLLADTTNEVTKA